MVWVESWAIFCSLYLTLLPTFIGSFNSESQTALLTVCTFHSVYALPTQWEPAREWCLPVPRLPPLCSFFLVKKAQEDTQGQYRSTSALRPELGRCFAGDSGMVKSCSSVFCGIHYLHFKTAFNEKVSLSKSSVRGQTITCGNSIFWAHAMEWQQFSSVFPEEVSHPSCCFTRVALKWFLLVSDGMKAKQVFSCWFLQQWEELRRCNYFSQFLLYISG